MRPWVALHTGELAVGLLALIVLGVSACAAAAARFSAAHSLPVSHALPPSPARRYERATLGVFPEALGTAVCSGLLLILVAVALCGSARLRSDLAIDDDGKETVAQRMVEGYLGGAPLDASRTHRGAHLLTPLLSCYRSPRCRA